QQSADREQGYPADSENTMRRKLGLQRKQDEGPHDERERGVARRQQVQREQRQQNENHAHHSRYNRPGMVEFHIERQRSYGEHQKGDVGNQQEVENPL